MGTPTPPVDRQMEGQTRIKTLPSPRTTYAGGKNRTWLTWLSRFPPLLLEAPAGWKMVQDARFGLVLHQDLVHLIAIIMLLLLIISLY